MLLEEHPLPAGLLAPPAPRPAATGAPGPLTQDNTPELSPPHEEPGARSAAQPKEQLCFRGCIGASVLALPAPRTLLPALWGAAGAARLSCS